MLEAKAREKAKREERVQRKRLKAMRAQMAAAGGPGAVVGGGEGEAGAAGLAGGATLQRDEGVASGDSEEEGSDDDDDGVGRKYGLGGIKAFEPDSDSDDDGEDDLEYMRQVCLRHVPHASLDVCYRLLSFLRVRHCCLRLGGSRGWVGETAPGDRACILVCAGTRGHLC